MGSRGHFRSMQPIPIICGPTASGKSALAEALAIKLGAAIVNADALQRYRDISVLTAQPDAATQQKIPHMLYGDLSATESSSAAAWLQKAEEVARKKERVIFCGGTGLYIKTLMQGISAIPAISEEYRRKAGEEYDALGGKAFKEKLAIHDPIIAQKLPAGDRQRLIRAYEVWLATGRPLSSYQIQEGQKEGEKEGEKAGSRFIPILLLPERADLYAACDKRFEKLVAGGAFQEIEGLMASKIPETAPVFKALGARELLAYLRGEISKEAAIMKAQQATRNYAKRQTTWFRHQLPPKALRFAAFGSAELQGNVLQAINSLQTRV